MAVTDAMFKCHSILCKILMPWVALFTLVLVLLIVRYVQDSTTDALQAHSQIHFEGAELATRLRATSVHRFTNALIYQSNPSRFLATEIDEAREKLASDLELLEARFDAQMEEHVDESFMRDESDLLENYRLSISGLNKLYTDFMTSVDLKDREKSRSLARLLTEKNELVLATLQDLERFHVKTSRLVEQERSNTTRQMDRIYFFLVAGLVLVSAVLSFAQTRAIANPIIRITEEARQIKGFEKSEMEIIEQHGELGELNQALNQMLGAIKERNKEIHAQQLKLAKAYSEVEKMVQRRTRELMKRTDELELANKDLENFSYSVSHDLRAPLRAIDGFLSILKEEYTGELDPEALRMFAIVQDNAQKMGRLIDDILAFSRAGRYEIELQDIDMQELINDVWDMLEAERGELDYQLRLGALPPIIGDPNALRQVLQNLLSNAIKFSRHVEHPCIDIEGQVGNEFVEYQVRDNGAGFNQAYDSKLFTMFERLHDAHEFEGTGVGLAIVKRFVQKHGGSISGESQPGAGATFRFRVPLAIEAAADD
jgi:signal transduction histidine kinase